MASELARSPDRREAGALTRRLPRGRPRSALESLAYGTARAIARVRNVARLGASIKRPNDDARLRSDAVYVNVCHILTEVTRGLASQAKAHAPSPRERALLDLAAACFRHVGRAIASDRAYDNGTPEGALTALLIEGLALIEAVNGTPLEITVREIRTLPGR